MTADQYRAARQQLGLKQSELAKQLGVTTNTISRRELGLVPISREADIAIKCLVINQERKQLPASLSTGIEPFIQARRSSLWKRLFLKKYGRTKKC